MGECGLGAFAILDAIIDADRAFCDGLAAALSVPPSTDMPFRRYVSTDGDKS